MQKVPYNNKGSALSPKSHGTIICCRTSEHNLFFIIAASSSKPATPSSGGVQLEDLQSILRNMGGAPTPANPVDLSEAMKADDIIPMLANEQIR